MMTATLRNNQTRSQAHTSRSKPWRTSPRRPFSKVVVLEACRSLMLVGLVMMHAACYLPDLIHCWTTLAGDCARAFCTNCWHTLTTAV
jgi:hypothetical protein